MVQELSQFRNWKTGKELLQKLEADPVWKCLQIDSIAIMPIRRIPRYYLLMQEYKKYNERDSNAAIALGLLKHTSEFINSEIRNQEVARAARENR